MFSLRSQSASLSLIEVKYYGKFSSTLIFEPPKVKPHYFKVFLKKLCMKIITNTAIAIRIIGEA